MASDPAGEFRARVRMTLRNWNGTWRRPALLNPFRYPGYAFALWSHKLLRWLSPIFIFVASVSSFSFIGHPYLWPLPLFVFAFFALAAIGWIGQITHIGLPIAGTVYSFCLANLGFFVGVAKAVSGHSVVAYERTQIVAQLGSARFMLRRLIEHPADSHDVDILRDVASGNDQERDRVRRRR